METLHFSENIISLRRARKITQEQLADFLGVTKASVSKWETKQSMPDVLLLPRLATYFGVTIDELLGYEPVLSKEQIQKIYQDLTEAFAGEEFETVMSRSRELVKKYYSCYEFLSHIVCLWLNHYMLPGGNRSIEILEEAGKLCDHVLEHCKDIALCNEVVLFKANVDLLLGKAKEVVESLEEMYDPSSAFIQGEGLLIQAYLQTGACGKANDFTQIMMYLHLISIVGEAGQYLAIHSDDLALCEETCQRVMAVSEIYNLEELNFNVMAVFYYQMATIYCRHGKKEKAIALLERYVHLSENFLIHEKFHLKGDAYFDRMDYWLEKADFGGNIPRDKKIIYESLKMSLEAPEFEVIGQETAFEKLKKHVAKFDGHWEK